MDFDHLPQPPEGELFAAATVVVAKQMRCRVDEVAREGAALVAYGRRFRPRVAQDGYDPVGNALWIARADEITV